MSTDYLTVASAIGPYPLRVVRNRAPMDLDMSKTVGKVSGAALVAEKNTTNHICSAVDFASISTLESDHLRRWVVRVQNNMLSALLTMDRPSTTRAERFHTVRRFRENWSRPAPNDIASAGHRAFDAIPMG
ncbi:hypothetical protein EVAR_60542_1 [Eumeta japonica]|uniref:Uncharacterized protein n=1 Tax=Eumeta variegata TaxID=151549 RepID=A0A4C1YW04_EUMVA|nr:hypothetical protein EVAR_60542_1 [Eumeta japonica]